MVKAVSVKTKDGGKETIVISCPACGINHSLIVKNSTGERPIWEWNGNLESPTFSPSLLVRWTDIHEDENGEYIPIGNGQYFHDNVLCHSFIRNGKIEFLSDCTHKYAGQTLDLIDCIL